MMITFNMYATAGWWKSKIHLFGFVIMNQNLR